MPTYEVNYGPQPVAEGLFLIRIDRPQAAAPYVDGGGKGSAHLSTFPERSTILEAVLNLLGRARRHVFFANFLIQEQEVVDALVAAAKRLQGHVYVLTTLKPEDFNSISLNQDNDADADIGADFGEHMACVEQLSRAGLLIKARSDCHAKFMSIDDEQAIVTSANAVPTCYHSTNGRYGRLRQPNGENGVLLTIPREVRRLANLFRAMWRDGCKYYVAPGGDVFDIADIPLYQQAVQVKEPPRSGGNEVIWTLPGDLRLREHLISMIQAAKQRIDLSTWVIKGMNDHAVGHALADAASRGVHVKIIVRGMQRADHCQQCRQLCLRLGEQVEILGDYLNHSKAVVADSHEALVLTANLDAQHGLDNGVEVGFRSTDSGFVAATETYLDRLSREAAFRFAPEPTQAAAAERYRVNGLSGDLRIEAPEAICSTSRLAELAAATERSLVSVLTPRKGNAHLNEVVLLIGQHSLNCQRNGRLLKVRRIDPLPKPKERDKYQFGFLGPGKIMFSALAPRPR